MENQLLTTGQVAIRIGCLPHQLQRLASAGRIPTTRAGKFYLFADADLPAIRSTLIAAGFVKAEKEVCNAAG